VAHWKLKKMQENDNKVEYTQKQGSHQLATEWPESRQEVDTNKIPQSTEKSNKTDDDDHLNDQLMTTNCPVSDHEVTKYITYNNNINNNNNKIN